MQVCDLPLALLHEAPWNPNKMGPDLLAKLQRSIEDYGVVENLIVRPSGKGYEVLSGNQRLRVCREMGLQTAPCLVINLDDSHARLLAQALNRTRGEDDLGLKAMLMRSVLENIPEEEVLALLPESGASLQALASLGQEDLAAQMQAWERAQAARLRHFAVQLTDAQLETVEEALASFMPQAKGVGGNPNARGSALYLLCQRYLELERRMP